MIPVGGITAENMAVYWQAGANGFGLGSALYRPGMTLDAIRDHAAHFRRSVATL
jgi:2-dehydro-3-deoxyphosphogalactonate aldolase